MRASLFKVHVEAAKCLHSIVAAPHLQVGDHRCFAKRLLFGATWPHGQCQPLASCEKETYCNILKLKNEVTWIPKICEENDDKPLDFRGTSVSAKCVVWYRMVPGCLNRILTVHVVSKIHLTCVNIKKHETSICCVIIIPTWWLIPLSKWVITPVINGISKVNPLITGVITYLLSGMSHQVLNIVFLSDFGPSPRFRQYMSPLKW